MVVAKSTSRVAWLSNLEMPTLPKESMMAFSTDLAVFANAPTILVVCCSPKKGSVALLCSRQSSPSAINNPGSLRQLAAFLRKVLGRDLSTLSMASLSANPNTTSPMTRDTYDPPSTASDQSSISVKHSGPASNMSPAMPRGCFVGGRGSVLHDGRSSLHRGRQRYQHAAPAAAAEPAMTIQEGCIYLAGPAARVALSKQSGSS
mmetsp:Transcript_21870/g.42478  ORF Transcript_21870/g.42478 Transcript_21870/m.42478 type:complete len:204 (-) Transcript_21870:8-619(-)